VQLSRGHQHTQPDVSAYIEHCVEILKNSGARITKPRLSVLECLASSRQTLSAAELLKTLQSGRKKSSVDLATIYRILDTFAELGIVHRVGAQGGFVACEHIDCEVAMHVVTHCIGCERNQEVDLPPEIQLAVSTYIKSATRFTPTDHFLQMNGRCSDCVARDKMKAKPR